MTAFCAFVVGLPALAAGVAFHMPAEAVLGLCALGMALITFLAEHEWKAWKRYRAVAHEPLTGQLRIGLAELDRKDEAA